MSRDKKEVTILYRGGKSGFECKEEKCLALGQRTGTPWAEGAAWGRGALWGSEWLNRAGEHTATSKNGPREEASARSMRALTTLPKNLDSIHQSVGKLEDF